MVAVTRLMAVGKGAVGEEPRGEGKGCGGVLVVGLAGEGEVEEGEGAEGEEDHYGGADEG